MIDTSAGLAFLNSCTLDYNLLRTAEYETSSDTRTGWDGVAGSVAVASGRARDSSLSVDEEGRLCWAKSETGDQRRPSGIDVQKLVGAKSGLYDPISDSCGRYGASAAAASMTNLRKQ